LEEVRGAKVYRTPLSPVKKLYNKIKYKLGLGYGGWYHKLTGKYRFVDKPGVVIRYEKNGKIKGRD
jgi:hypothetical protein